MRKPDISIILDNLKRDGGLKNFFSGLKSLYNSIDKFCKENKDGKSLS